MILHMCTKEYVSSIKVHQQKSQADVSIFNYLVNGYCSRGYILIVFCNNAETDSTQWMSFKQ